MAILLDTGFFVALNNLDDVHHKRAVAMLRDLVSGEYGQRVTLDYVLDEAVTATWVRTKDKHVVASVYQLLMGKNAVAFLMPFSITRLPQAWASFEKYSQKDRPLSFTDCCLICFAEERNIDLILSFDSEFDGILKRIY